jgi:hypothetical protein
MYNKFKMLELKGRRKDMRYLALILSLGIINFSFAQTNDQLDDLDDRDRCVKDNSTGSNSYEYENDGIYEGRGSLNESENDAFSQGNEDMTNEALDESRLNSDGTINQEPEYDYENDVYSRGNDDLDESFDNSSALRESDAAAIPEPVITTASTEIKVDDQEKDNDGSVVGTIIKAPFKAGFSVVSEVGEGVGHIAGAPFKGLAKLFGHDDD